MNNVILSPFLQTVIGLISFVIVAFGQPAWSGILGLLASVMGYALFWRVLLCYPKIKHRFFLGTVWFFSVQMVQLSWLTSHPYFYIYFVQFLLSVYLGLQFGLLCLLIQPKLLSRFWCLLSIASIWTLFEWSRLFFLSGYTWNPAGLALTASLYSLQMASIWGIYGLTFWVIFTNLLALRAWFSSRYILPWACAAALPYIFGAIHLNVHLKNFEKHEGAPFNALLLQTAFPVEEIMDFSDKQSMIQYVLAEWETILKIAKKNGKKPIDLIALPEFVVPFGTYTFVYPFDNVKELFLKILGPDSLAHLPPFENHLAISYKTPKGVIWVVNNAFWAQAMANYFNAGVIVGLEDAEDVSPEKREYYSSAVYFKPQYDGTTPASERYEKRVLLPMGEYIPFEFCRELASKYGILGSFTPGQEAKVMPHSKAPFGVSICYEETFGDLMRENKQKGAEVLVNLTSDVWYPSSLLPRQHLDHARLRTVENGIPLVRACNTGITCAIDSMGRVVDVLGGETPAKVEWIADSIRIEVPTYTYSTLYSKVGDKLILGISLFFTLIFLACLKYLL